ncbi:MAG TPA: hypothetical protein VHC69_14845 [Polyangiaceae bacterium]|nr:hypothetical protein [Polyangiaceae bacterium]
MPPSTKLPAPENSDPREVAFALEEAIAHFAAGKKDEALYALSRAVEAAEHASLDERARALRAAVADLSASGSPSTTASVRPAPPPAAAKAPAAPAARPGAQSHAPPPPSSRAAAPVAVPSAPPSNGSAAPSATQVDRSNGKHEGLHVWVRTSARDPTLLLVRLLPDGHPAPPGAYEAYLRPVEDGVNLLAPKH